VAGLILALSGVASVRAADTIWNNTLADGDINNAANWSGGLPSQAGTIGATVSTTPLVINQAFNNGGDNRSLYLIVNNSLTIADGGSFTYFGDGLLAWGVAATITHTGGTLIQDGGGAGFLMGLNVVCTYNISGGNLYVQGTCKTLTVNYSGASGSSLNISGLGRVDVEAGVALVVNAGGTLNVTGAGLLVWHDRTLAETNAFTGTVNAKITQVGSDVHFTDPTPTTPAVDSPIGATNVLGTSAWLTGDLVSTGGAPTRVWICWGEDDEEDDFAAWSSRIDMGMRLPGPFSSHVTGLISDTSYVYRCAASNLYGMVWSGVQTFVPSYPRLSIDSIEVVEGNAGATQAVFTVRLSPVYPEVVSFSMATSNGTAEASSDYEALAGTRSIPPGGSELQIPVTVYGDETEELDEDFFLLLHAPSNAVIENGASRCLILSDDRNNYLSPSALVTDTNRMLLYVAQSSAKSVAVVDLNTQGLVDVLALPQDPSGLALSGDGGTLYVTAGVASGSVHVVDTTTRQLTRTISVGHSPRSPVVASSNRLYVCEQFENAVSVMDPTAGSVIDSIPVLRQPFCAALTPDGAKLLVGNLLPHQPATETGVAASVSVIDTATGMVTAHVALPPGSHSLRDVAVSPDGRYAVVAHALGRYRVPATQIFRGWVNTSTLSIIDLASATLYNTVEIDDLDLGAANPWGVGFTADGQTLCITHAGTHELSAIDWNGLLTKLETATENVCDDLTYMAGLRRRLPLPGNGPRGLAIVGANVYTANYFSDSVAVADLTAGQEYAAQEISLGWVKPQTDVRLGEQLFHDATLSAQQWQSCASCHPGVRVDGLNWDLLNDGFGNAKNVKSLLNAHFTPPTTWTGARPNAETSVRAGIMFSHMIKWKNDENLYLDAYLKAQQPVPSPYLVNGALSAAALRGQATFNTRCIACHSGPKLTDLQLHDVGTGTPVDAGPFDTPSLIEVWRTAPYLHDGRAQTIRDVLDVFSHGSTSGLTEEELNDLVEYVNSL